VTGGGSHYRRKERQKEGRRGDLLLLDRRQKGTVGIEKKKKFDKIHGGRDVHHMRGGELVLKPALVYRGSNPNVKRGRKCVTEKKKKKRSTRWTEKTLRGRKEVRKNSPRAPGNKKGRRGVVLKGGIGSGGGWHGKMGEVKDIGRGKGVGEKPRTHLFNQSKTSIEQGDSFARDLE